MGIHAYNIMSFGLKNSPIILSHIVIVAFHEYINKFLEFYMDDWTVYTLLKNYPSLLHIMFDRCKELQISLNLKKCIFVLPFGTQLGHIIYKGVCVDTTKFAVILNMPPPTFI